MCWGLPCVMQPCRLSCLFYKYVMHRKTLTLLLLHD